MIRRFRIKSLAVIIVVVGLAFAALVPSHIDVLGFERGSDEILGLQLGLDLAGGAHLVYEAGDETLQPTEDQMEGLINIISRRVNQLGVTEPSVQQLGDNRIVVQLPGVEDTDRAEEVIGRTARLEIIERRCLNAACTEFEDLETGLTGDDMARAYPGQDQATGEPILLFDLTPAAAQDFARITQRINASGDQLAFVLDGEDLVSAGVEGAILAGSGVISGEFSFEDVRDLAIQVESGRLPIDTNLVSSSVVAATLGSLSLENALFAGVVGLLLVMFFMIVYYRAAGLTAAFALVFYTAIVLATFKLIPVTLTLAGLAGFVLSLGMAVDANILIFERVKEELRTGRTLPFSLQMGFNRAWPAIRDGNISTLIIAAILYSFGSGAANYAVTGFAVTLAIGVAVSMFTAIVISRNLLFIMAATPLRHLPVFSPEGKAKRPAPTIAAQRGA
ncbi:MAG: protein translocase subunit SecD [Dehalococcoidia bacterium]